MGKHRGASGDRWQPWVAGGGRDLLPEQKHWMGQGQGHGQVSIPRGSYRDRHRNPCCPAPVAASKNRKLSLSLSLSLSLVKKLQHLLGEQRHT